MTESKLRNHDRLIRAMDYFKRPGYTPQYNLVLRHLADRYNAKQGCAYPSVEDICKHTWISENQVRRIISTLEKDGLLRVVRRLNHSSRYTLIFPAEALRHLEVLARKSTEVGVAEVGEGYSPSISPYSENISPYSESMSAYLESTQTAIEPPFNTPHGKHHQTQVQRQASAAVPLSSRDEVEDQNRSFSFSNQPTHSVQLGPTAPTPREALSPSAARPDPTVVAELAEVFAESFGIKDDKVDAVDFEDLLAEWPERTIKQTLRWATKRSDYWRGQVKSSYDLAFSFGTMTGQFTRYMDEAKKSRRGGSLIRQQYLATSKHYERRSTNHPPDENRSTD